MGPNKPGQGLSLHTWPHRSLPSKPLRRKISVRKDLGDYHVTMKDTHKSRHSVKAINEEYSSDIDPPIELCDSAMVHWRRCVRLRPARKWNDVDLLTLVDLALAYDRRATLNVELQGEPSMVPKPRGGERENPKITLSRRLRREISKLERQLKFNTSEKVGSAVLAPGRPPSEALGSQTTGARAGHQIGETESEEELDDFFLAGGCDLIPPARPDWWPSDA